MLLLGGERSRAIVCAAVLALAAFVTTACGGSSNDATAKYCAVRRNLDTLLEQDNVANLIARSRDVEDQLERLAPPEIRADLETEKDAIQHTHKVTPAVVAAAARVGKCDRDRCGAKH